MRARDLRLRCNNQTLKDFMPIIPLEQTSYFKRSKSLKGHVVSQETRIKISIANTGKKLTLVHRKKLSSANLGKKLSPETCKKMSLSRMGRLVSQQTREKIRLSQIGKIISEETRQKMILANRKKGNDPIILDKIRKANTGKKQSKESIAKRVLKNTGKKRTEQQKNNIRDGLISSPNFEERSKKISRALKGRIITPEWKEKLRIKRLHQVFPTKDTKPERMMQLALALHGIKFTKHKPIIGQPDIFIEPNICVFVDGDYPHANPIKYDANDIIYQKTASDIWARDSYVNHELNEQGYCVIRVWGSKINEDANVCAINIISLISNQRLNPKIKA